MRTRIKLSEVINFNPKETIKKGTAVKKIPMSLLQENNRKLKGHELGVYSGGAKFRNHDTLLAKISPCLENGKTAYVDILDEDEIGSGSTEFIVLRNSVKTIPLYIYYLVRSPNFRKKAISCMEGTSGRKRVNENTLKNYEIDLPSLEEQENISKILSDIDSKIELNEKINNLLENLAKTIYDFWFVQFDFPDENGKPYKSSGGKMFWNEELQKEIPEGWLVQNLKENSISKLIKPGINNFENFKTYLATADVDNNRINLNADKVTLNNRESRANMQPIKDSIWFAKMKSSKKVMYFGNYSDYFVNNFILSTGFAGLKVNNSVYLEYLWCFINNDNFEKIKDLLSNGATQKAINNENMQYIPLLIPNFEIIKKFHEVTKDIYHKIYNINIENNELTELRYWLLPMLMNGQVTIND